MNILNFKQKEKSIDFEKLVEEDRRLTTKIKQLKYEREELRAKLSPYLDENYMLKNKEGKPLGDCVPGKTTSFDKKTFGKDHPELVKKYSKKSERKGTWRWL